MEFNSGFKGLIALGIPIKWGGTSISLSFQCKVKHFARNQPRVLCTLYDTAWWVGVGSPLHRRSQNIRYHACVTVGSERGTAVCNYTATRRCK